MSFVRFIALLTCLIAFSNSTELALPAFNDFLSCATALNSFPFVVKASLPPLTKLIFALCAVCFAATFSASACIKAVLATCLWLSDSCPNAGIIVVKIVEPNNSNPPVIPILVLLNNVIKGVTNLLIIFNPFSVKFANAADILSKGLGSTRPLRSPYFSAP